MARRVLNRRELRQDGEAAEREGAAEKEKAPRTAAKKTTAKKTRAKAAKDAPRKAFWGVFSQSLKPVALFEYSQREEADKKAEELGKSGKSPHFVQLVKQ